MAIVTERTVGIAIGIPPISKTSRLSIPFLYPLWWTAYITMISITIPIAIEQMQKFPIDVRTCNNYVMSHEHYYPDNISQRDGFTRDRKHSFTQYSVLSNTGAIVAKFKQIALGLRYTI